MALDVHIIGHWPRWPTDASYTSFGFGNEHEEIVCLADVRLSSGSQIARMRDYYSNMVYAGEDLVQLIGELDQLISGHQEAGDLGVVLKKYRKICVQAAQEDKAILLSAD